MVPPIIIRSKAGTHPSRVGHRRCVVKLRIDIVLCKPFCGKFARVGSHTLGPETDFISHCYTSPYKRFGFGPSFLGYHPLLAVASMTKLLVV